VALEKATGKLYGPQQPTVRRKHGSWWWCRVRRRRTGRTRRPDDDSLADGKHSYDLGYTLPGC
jgi:hypothetical protein